MAERRGPPSLTWERGTVKQVNEYGLKLDGDDDWRNWSQYGLKEAERPTLTVGQKVKVGQDKDGYVRDVKGPSDEVLPVGGTVAAGGSGSRGFTEADSWRMTLLSCLSTAADWIPTQPEEIQAAMRENRDDKDHPLSPSQSVYRVARIWAERAWRDPVPKPPPPAPTEPEQ